MNHIQQAILQIGVQEDPIGSNWGKDLTKGVPMYLASVGIHFPASWCAAFVYWCCKESDPNTPLIKTGGVLMQWNQINAQYKHSIPQSGDIFIQDHGHGLGHTGFVESVIGDKIHTIEGNASLENGGREGYIVTRKQRDINSCVGFIRV